MVIEYLPVKLSYENKHIIFALRDLMIATSAIRPYTHGASPLFDRAFEKVVHLYMCVSLCALFTIYGLQVRNTKTEF